MSCVAFNWNDTSIASGSVNGDILLHNVMTGQASDPLRLAKTQVCSRCTLGCFSVIFHCTCMDY